jgi:hypothetical protein
MMKLIALIIVLWAASQSADAQQPAQPPPRAVQAATALVESLKQAADVNPTPARQAQLARAYFDLGNQLILSAEFVKGQLALEKSLEIREELARRDPSNLERQNEVLVSLMVLVLGDPSKKYARRAEEIFASLDRQGKLTDHQKQMRQIVANILKAQ